MQDLIEINNSKILSFVNVVEFSNIINSLKRSTLKRLYILFKEKPYENPYVINPLFWIFVMNYHKKYGDSKHMLIDITHLPYKTQFIIINHLKQYIDYNLIVLRHKENPTEHKYLEKETTHYSHFIRLNSGENGKIVLNYSTGNKYFDGLLPRLLKLADLSELTSQPSNTTLTFEDEAGEIIHIDTQDFDFMENRNINLNYLPIINITNLEMSQNLSIPYDEENYLKNLYIHTKINFQDTAYKTKNIWDKIFSTYLNITNNNSHTLNAFKNLIVETVSNIQQHTDKDKTSGYISFYKNTVSRQNEFYICDDFEKGFLTTYLQTMKDEYESEINEKARQGYEKIILDLEAKRYKQVLENIFTLNYILDAQSKRVKIHFGMPMLLKLLLNFSLNPAKLTMIVSDENGESFQINYQKDNPVEVIPLKVIINGTYLYISFPINATINDFQQKSKESLVLKTSNYRNIFQEKNNEIQKQMLLFEKVQINKLDHRHNLLPSKESIVINFEDNDLSLSDFLRKIYAFAYLKSVKDILIINFPLDEDENYMNIFLSTSNICNIANIIFLNSSYPKVMFIGGHSDEAFHYINYKLSQTYNYDKTNYGSRIFTEDNKPDIQMDSNLFYINNNKEQSLIPFELFLNCEGNILTETSPSLYTRMIDNFLNQNSNFENIHLDLKNGLHLSKFYYLKHIFENSQWIDLISFDLARRIELIRKDVNLKNIVLVGIEKYSSILLSVTQSILGSDFKIYIIENLKNEIVIEKFNEFTKENTDTFFIFFRPVVFEFYEQPKKDKLQKGIEDNNKKFISAIKLITRNHQSIDWDTLHKKDLEKENIIANIDNNGNIISCPLCFPDYKSNSRSEKPLYRIDDDKYNIKNLYKDMYSVSSENISTDVNWKNSIYFGHTYRKMNHYLYYIKTIQFLSNNKTLIETFFKQKKFIYDKSKVSIILSPNHNTNSEFITLVNRIVFDNNAIIHTFSLDYKEQVFYSLEYYRKLYNLPTNHYKFYFIDDEISSGDTLEYFYNILKQITDNQVSQFEAIFTLIDRTTEKDKKNILDSYYNENNFYSFIKLNIHPIKTGFEDCYLCKRVEYLQDIVENSSLVFIKHSYMSKVKSGNDKKSSLQKYKSDEIEYEVVDAYDDFKNYLKMYATEFIYEKLENFSTIKNEFDLFKKKVYIYVEKHYLYNDSCSNELKIIIDFEAEIAFIKSLSFPKVLFFQNLKDKIHQYIYEKLYSFIIDNNTGLVKCINQSFIDAKIKDFSTLENSPKILSAIIEEFKKQNKTNIHEFNFYLSIASYLGVNFIMSEKMIEFYFKLTTIIKDSNPSYQKHKKLLGVYPVIIKQITYYSEEKSKYFNDELSKFYKNNKFQYTRQYSRIFGLYVENTKFLQEKESTLSEGINKRSSLENNLSSLLSNLDIFIKKEDSFGTKYSKENIKIINFYIDINQDINNPKSIDILNNYKESNEDSIEIEMIKGAHVIKSDPSNQIIEEIKHNKDENPYNIWCNFLKNDTTYIRLTDTELIPMGVIIVKHNFTSDLSDNEKLLIHLKISRRVLAKQNEIIEIFKENELISNIRTKYDDKLKVEQFNKEKQIHQDIISKINHSTFSKIKIYTKLSNEIDKYETGYISCEDFVSNILKIKDFSIIIEYVASIGKYYSEAIVIEKDNTPYNFSQIFTFEDTDTEFYKQIKKFLKLKNMSPLLNGDYSRNLVIDNRIENFANLTVSKKLLEYVIFELIHNALKNNQEKLDILVTYDKTFDVEKVIIKNNLSNSQNSSYQESNGVGFKAIQNIMQIDNIRVNKIDDKTHFTIELIRDL
jgi:hypothetical protein